MDLDECDRLMQARDLGFYAHPDDRGRTLAALADEVPGLVLEVRRLAPLLETMTRDADSYMKERDHIEKEWEKLKAEVERLRAAESILVDQHEADHKEIVRLTEQTRNEAVAYSTLAKSYEAQRNEVIRQEKKLDAIDAKLRDANLQVRDLVDSLEHMKVCADCGEDSWNLCDGGRAALAALERVKGAENRVSDPKNCSGCYTPKETCLGYAKEQKKCCPDCEHERGCYARVWDGNGGDMTNCGKPPPCQDHDIPRGDVEKRLDAPTPPLPYSGAGTTEERSEATHYKCVRCWIDVPGGKFCPKCGQ